MKAASPTLVPLLRSRSSGGIVAASMLDPQRERSLREIAGEAGTSVSTVLREVARLEEGGAVTTTRRGNTGLVRAVTDSVVYKPLADLLAVIFGPAGVLCTVLAEISGIERAFIYGSWAARYAERSGRVPGDIDLLVIGEVDRHVLADALVEAESVLRREINVRRVSVDVWVEDNSSFKQIVLSRPVVEVIGKRDE